MHSMPTRIVLAGSVLALGSVGTVSAVHLESAPAPLGTTPGTPLALTPVPATPATTKAPEVPAPVRVLPTPKGGSTARTNSDERAPLNARDLVDLAAGPLPKRTVTVALHQIEDAADSDSDDSDYDSDADSDSNADSDSSDEDARDFAGRTGRHWSGHTDRWRGRDAQDGSHWGRRISDPFQAAQQWRDSGPRSHGVSSRGESSRGESARGQSAQWHSSDRDYVGRHRADC
jgi:hypothetical protein